MLHLLDNSQLEIAKKAIEEQMVGMLNAKSDDVEKFTELRDTLKAFSDADTLYINIPHVKGDCR